MAAFSSSIRTEALPSLNTNPSFPANGATTFSDVTPNLPKSSVIMSLFSSEPVANIAFSCPERSTLIAYAMLARPDCAPLVTVTL